MQQGQHGHPRNVLDGDREFGKTLCNEDPVLTRLSQFPADTAAKSLI
jgi:hypothetical protein